MKRHTKDELRHQRIVMRYATEGTDVLSEEQLRQRLAQWRTKLSKVEEGDPYYDQCKKMTKLYELRIDRLGVRQPCVD